MPDWTTITLTIKESAGGNTFTSHLYVDEAPVATNRTLSPADTQTQRELSAGYLSWFEQPQIPLVEEEDLRTIGTQLFETWLADDWKDVEEVLAPTGRRRFVVASDVPAILNLPWSLLRLPEADEPVGLDPTSSVRLHPATERLAKSNDERRPGPLRVLYSACAPRDAVELGYEKEEYQLLQTLTQPDQDVAHFGCDLGAFNELQNRVREYRPHVVHLTGHGVVDEGEAHFAFEDEKGDTDLRPGDQIVRDALAGRGVQCVFVSGCETGQAPTVEATNGLCQDLVASGVPLSVGWAASILDDVAMEFGDTFYAELSAGEDVDRAVVQARRDARRLCAERVEEDGVIDASWTLPVLYTATTQADLFDPSQHEDPPKPSVEQNPLPGMTEGHADYFIGRRREQQRLLPDLRSGSLNTVFLTGLGGVGKSTLATRLARALEKDGFTPIAVPSTEDDPLTAGRLLDRCYEAFLAEDVDDGYQRLGSEEIALRDKLRLLVHLLNRNQFTLVLDNFEENMDRESHKILNDTLAWFLPYLVDNLTGSSRCLVTSRYRPAALGDDLPPVATERSLSGFPESAFFKYLLDDEAVRQRYRSGDLPRDLLSRVYELLGGTPRFLEQVREVLQDMPTDELEDALDAVDLPEDADENRLQALRDEYVQDLFVDQLYGAIEPPGAREALSRAAVYTISMTAEGYAAAADADETDVRDWLDAWRRLTLVAPVQTDDSDTERWIIPTLLRPWLLEQIDEGERREAHQAAGEFLFAANEPGRQTDFGVPPPRVEMEARSRFVEAADFDRARDATERISANLTRWGSFDKVRQLNEELLAHEKHPSTLKWLGRADLEQAKYEQARARYDEALKMEREAGNLQGEMIAQFCLASVAERKGAYDQAREKFEMVLDMSQEMGDKSMEASARQSLASVASSQGEYDFARKESKEALEIQREVEDRSGEAATRHQLASIALNQGRHDRALEEFEEVLEIQQEVGDLVSQLSTRHQLATIALRQGKYSLAWDEFEGILEYRRGIGDRSGEASTLHSLAEIARRQGRYDEAKRILEEVLEVYEEIEHKTGLAATRHSLGSLALDQGEYDRARKELEGALEIDLETSNRSGEATARHQLASIALREGRYEEAQEEFEKALDLRIQIGNRPKVALTRQELARVLGEQGEHGRASKEFGEALRIHQEMRNRVGEATVFGQLGALASMIGRKRYALRLHILATVFRERLDYPEKKESLSWVERIVSEIDLSRKELASIEQETLDAYKEDRGWSLIQKAFPDADHPDDVPSPE